MERWQLFDEHDVLHQTLAKLPDSFCANSEGVPTWSAVRKQEDEEKEMRKKEMAFKSSIAGSLEQLANATTHQGRMNIIERRMNSIERRMKQVREIRFELERVRDEATREPLRRDIAYLQESIAKLEKQTSGNDGE